MNRSLFISKNEEELIDFEDQFTSLDFSVTAESFLDYKLVNFVLNRKFDWVFFSSPRSVVFFLSQQTLGTNVKIACVGSKTADTIADYKLTVDYCGSSSNIAQIAGEFKKLVGDDVVLFPISDRSLKSVSTLFEQSKKIELEVYQTQLISKEIKPHEIYVFTSPSNVDGFLLKNKMPNSARIIAWGTSTANKLNAVCSMKIEVMSQSNIETLLQIL